MAMKICRKNTLRATFDKEKQRPSAVEIHQWVEQILKVRESDLQTLQLVGKENAIYLKFVNVVTYEQVLQQHGGTTTFQLLTGETTTVNITSADGQITNVRVLNVPPEVPNERIENVCKNYGKIQTVENEKWSHKYRFKVDSGIRLVTMIIEKPIPSTLIIAGYEAYVTYLGQEQTCFHCGNSSHLRHNCPQRILREKINVVPRTRPQFNDLFHQTITNNSKYEDTVTHGEVNPEITKSKEINETEKENENITEIINPEHVVMNDISDDVNTEHMQVHSDIKESSDTLIQQNQSDEDTESAEEVDVQDRSNSTLHSEVSSQGPASKRRKNRQKSSLAKQKQRQSQEEGQSKQTKLTDSTTSKQHTNFLSHEHPAGNTSTSWADEMEAESSTASAADNKGTQTHDPSQKVKVICKQRIHPYKPHESKLGFPPLKHIDS